MRRHLLTAFGLGTLPRAPGTWGSLPVAILFAVLMVTTTTSNTSIVLLILLIGASVVTIWFGQWAAEHWGRRDPPELVSDEVAGQSLVFLCLPWGDRILDDHPLVFVAIAIVGFLLFRLFDILKPFPIRLMEQLKDGWGVLMDDLLAGLIAGLLLWLLVWGVGLGITSG